MNNCIPNCQDPNCQAKAQKELSIQINRATQEGLLNNEEFEKAIDDLADQLQRTGNIRRTKINRRYHDRRGDGEKMEVEEIPEAAKQQIKNPKQVFEAVHDIIEIIENDNEVLINDKQRTVIENTIQNAIDESLAKNAKCSWSLGTRVIAPDGDEQGTIVREPIVGIHWDGDVPGTITDEKIIGNRSVRCVSPSQPEPQKQETMIVGIPNSIAEMNLDSERTALISENSCLRQALIELIAWTYGGSCSDCNMFRRAPSDIEFQHENNCEHLKVINKALVLLGRQPETGHDYEDPDAEMKRLADERARRDNHNLPQKNIWSYEKGSLFNIYKDNKYITCVYDEEAAKQIVDGANGKQDNSQLLQEAQSAIKMLEQDAEANGEWTSFAMNEASLQLISIVNKLKSS